MQNILQPVVVNVNSHRLFDSTAKSCINKIMNMDANEPAYEKQLKIDIGKRLRLAREAATHSQTALAELVGVKQQTIQGIEAGEKKTDYCNLVRIERALGLASGYLLYGKSHSVLEVPQPLIANCPILTWECAYFWPSDKSNVIEKKLFDKIEKKLILGSDSYILRIPDSQYESYSEPDAPFFRKGSYIIIDPEKKYKNGDFVIAKIKEHGRLIFRRFVQYDDGKTFLKVIKEGHRSPLMDLTPDIEITGVMVAHFDFR
jgi:SOS-response transcriptional repressor LexA